jgi:hypothetical protein
MHCWPEFVRLFMWGGTPEGAIFMIGLGVVGGLAIGWY